MTLQHNIIQAAKAYYSGDPIISDEEFDALTDQLPTDHVLRLTPGWGGNELTTLKTKKVIIPHKSFIGGLPKSKFSPSYTPALYSEEISPKLDGLTGVAYYDNEGLFKHMVTRGNGKYGLMVHSATNMVPNKAYPNAEIRGEIVIRENEWQLIKSEYSHPRNAAAGIVNSQGESPHSDKLSFIAFESNGPETQLQQRLRMLSMSYNFNIVKVFNFHTEQEYDNSNLTDGLPWKNVCPFDDNRVVVDGSVWSNIKTGAKHAYKYDNSSAETTVTNITWRCSPQGRLNPTVHFNPVFLDGAKIRKCTGHNADNIHTLKLGLGAKIKVSRLNNVIPGIVGVLQPADTLILPGVPYYRCGKFFYATKDEDLSTLLAKAHRRMIASKSPKGISSTLMDHHLGYRDVLELSFAHYGKGTQHSLCTQALTAAQNTKWSLFELIQAADIPSIGKRAIESYLLGKGTPRIKALIQGDELLKALIEQHCPQVDFPEGFFPEEIPTAGKQKVAITGKLDGHSKKSFAEAYNIILVDINDADVVIAVSLDSSKAQKAQRLGKTIITQQEFEQSK